MIAGVRSGAGLALMETGPGCSRCLIERLTEAGFHPESTAVEVETAGIPKAVTQALKHQQDGWAPVVLLRHGQATSHPLLPFPDCPECGVRQVQPTTSELPAEWLLDPLTGIASCLEYQDAGSDADLLCCVVTGRVHLPLAASPEFSEGKGPTTESAGASQLGETVERYSAFHAVAARLVHVRWQDLGTEAPPLALFNGYDARQLARTGYKRLRSRDELAWIQGRRLNGETRCFVPASSVFLHRSWLPQEVRFAPMLSTGTASHRSPGEARVRAQLEVIERYVVMQAWNRGCFGSPMREDDLAGGRRRMFDRIAANGLTLVLRELERPPRVPVILAALAGPRFPWICFGSGAGLTTAVATYKAVEEAAMTWQTLVHWDGPKPGRRARLPVMPPCDQMLLAANRQRSCRLLRKISGGEMTGPSPNAVSAHDVSRQVTALCPHAVEVDLTSVDCRMCGFHVVKVVTPGLPTLAFGTAGTPALHLAAYGIPRARSLHPFG